MKISESKFIFKPTGEFEWSKEFAQVPTPIELEDRIRIYYTTRPIPEDGKSISYTSFIDVDKECPENVIYIHDKPVIELGKKGSFDEFGIHPGTTIKVDDKIYFYYQGWTRMYSVPYSTSLGLAISDDNGFTFKKFSDGPIMGRNIDSPYLDNGFFIFQEKNKYYMFFSAAKEWYKTLGGNYEPVYQIVRAESKDRINWKSFSLPILSTNYNKEANGRATVTKFGKRYYMWFCYRDVELFRENAERNYKIAYAISDNLISWKRINEDIFSDYKKTEWYNKMQAYPYLIKIKQRYFLFFSGNYFGKEGFGYSEIIL